MFQRRTKKAFRELGDLSYFRRSIYCWVLKVSVMFKEILTLFHFLFQCQMELGIWNISFSTVLYLQRFRDGIAQGCWIAEILRCSYL